MTDVIQQLQEAADKATQASAQASIWATGPINLTVPTDSGPIPTIAEFTRANQELADAAIAALGWVLAGDFTAGCTVTERNQYVLVVGGPGYRWDGVIPLGGKVVAPGSSPTPVATGAWVLVSDATLRGDLAKVGGAGLITDTLKPVTWSGFAGGADKTGVVDSTAALNDVYTAANSNGQSIIIPAGTYKVGASMREVQSDTIWLSRDFNSGVSATDAAQRTPLLITVGNPDEPVIDFKHNRAGVNITAIGRGAQHIDGIRSSLINYSTDGEGNTAFYGSAVSSASPTGWSAAVHGETKHGGGTTLAISSESASYSVDGVFYGAVLNNTTGSAAEFHPITGLPVVAHPTATALYITGGTTRGDMGQWVRGVHFGPLSMRANGTIIRDQSVADKGYWSLQGSSKSTADILLEGACPTAIILNGTYSSGNAIRLKSGDSVAYEATGAIKTRYSAADVQWGLYNGSTQRVGFGTAAYGMYFNGLKVVGERQVAIPNASVGSEVSVINSILSAMRNHGLIATV